MQLRTEVEIAAPAERVWAALTDFSRYPEWNPFMAHVEGELSVGSRLRVAFTTSEGGGWRQSPTLTMVEPGLELRWRSELWLRGLFDSEHFLSLSALESGNTRLVHGADLGGFLARFSGDRITQITRGCVGMNQALKRRVESR